MTIATNQSARYNTDAISCEDLQKPEAPILTGLGFLDHMIDQFNSHAQIGISMTVANLAEGDVDVFERNRHASSDQGKLMSLTGSRIGAEFKRLVDQAGVAVGQNSRFACPLDEALVVCVLERAEPGHGTLSFFSLPPYGKYPSSGRQYVGHMETDKLKVFFEGLAVHADLDIRLEKLRGKNAHHVIESAFKASSRALRNLLDGVNTSHPESTEQLYGSESDNWKEGVAMKRKGSVSRKTKETAIRTDLCFDGGVSGIEINTGIMTLDSFLITLAKNACISLQISCYGDLWIDEHHTAEDVAIALGQALDQAFGTKAGLNRMWCASAEAGPNTKIEVVMDLSNRPCFTHNLNLDNGNEKEGDLTLEMFEHVLDSIVINARMTVHIMQIHATENLGDTLQATATAFGQALKYCTMIDRRRSGATASSKGTLSV